MCYWKLGKPAEAAPLLRRAKASFPANESLQRALYAVDRDLIWDLSEELLKVEDPAARRAIYRKQAALHEETLHYIEAAKTFALSLSPRPTASELIRAGYLHKMARSYGTAADAYLAAARISPDQVMPTLWAIDCLLLGGRNDEAEKLLTPLAERRLGPEVEWLLARLYRAKGQEAKARLTLQTLGKYYEREARRGRDVRASRLQAAKAYVEGGDPARGMEMLNRLADQTPYPDPAIDLLRGDHLMRERHYLPAVAIYRRHPDSVPMQVNAGWAMARAGQPAAAQRHFAELMKRFPQRPEVLEGWQALGTFRTWGAAYHFTRHDFSDDQDPRDVHDLRLTHDGEKAAATVGWTRTETHVDRDGDYDFTENLLAARIYRRLNKYSAAQIHGMNMQNDDWLTDNGWTFGGKYFRFARPNFSWTAELDTSSYPDLHALQTSLGAAFRLDRHWNLTAGLDVGFLQGNEASRAETRTPSGLRGSISHEDHNARVTLAGFTGTRVRYVDSTNLYIFPNIDTYRQGGSLEIAQKAENLDLFLNVGTVRATAQYLRQSKAPLWKPHESDYRITTLTGGATFKFF